MKKFIALAVALVSLGAIAQEHKHMVTLSGYEHDTEARSLDLTYSKDDADKESKTQNIALNYAYALNGSWQIGANFKKFTEEFDGDKEAGSYTSYGLKVIYNFAGKLTDTNYLALGYDMAKYKDDAAPAISQDDDKSNTISLEFGHRFSLGTLWGMNFNWSPSVVLAQESYDPDAGDKVKTTFFTVNVLKVDVLF